MHACLHTYMRALELVHVRLHTRLKLKCRSWGSFCSESGTVRLQAGKHVKQSIQTRTHLHMPACTSARLITWTHARLHAYTHACTQHICTDAHKDPYIDCRASRHLSLLSLSLSQQQQTLAGESPLLNLMSPSLQALRRSVNRCGGRPGAPSSRHTHVIRLSP